LSFLFFFQVSIKFLATIGDYLQVFVCRIVLFRLVHPSWTFIHPVSSFLVPGGPLWTPSLPSPPLSFPECHWTMLVSFFFDVSVCIDGHDCHVSHHHSKSCWWKAPSLLLPWVHMLPFVFRRRAQHWIWRSFWRSSDVSHTYFKLMLTYVTIFNFNSSFPCHEEFSCIGVPAHPGLWQVNLPFYVVRHC
jgi:hypothetical protein